MSNMDRHDELLAKVVRFLRRRGFDVVDNTYHNSLASSAQNRLVADHGIGASVVRTAADLFVVHKEVVGCHFWLDVKTNPTGFDFIAEALPVYEHYRMWEEYGERTLYVHQWKLRPKWGVVGAWIDKGFIDAIAVTILYKKECRREVNEWVEKHHLSDEVRRSDSAKGSEDPMILIRGDIAEKFPPWRGLLQDFYKERKKDK